MNLYGRSVRRVFYRSLAALGQHRALQLVSSRFWAAESNSFIAPTSYYDHREIVLRQLPSHIGHVRDAIDIGCGNLHFEVAELDVMRTASSYSLAMCIGVTSCIIDDAKRDRLMKRIRRVLSPDGHLILVDTVTSAPKSKVNVAYNGYVAKYRSIGEYEACLGEHGFQVLRSDELAAWSPTLTNRVWLAIPSAASTAPL